MKGLFILLSYLLTTDSRLLRPYGKGPLSSRRPYRRPYGGGEMFSADLKKGSMQMLILSLLEERSRHGYEIGKLIESRSGGKLKFALPSVYPALLRLENQGWIKGRWVEKPGERQRCFYRLTAAGRRVLASQKDTWKEYIAAVNRVLGASRA